MDPRLIELYVQRGRLRERIASQRGDMAHLLAPVGSALQTVDRGRLLWRQASAWMAAHPALVTATVVAVVVWRPRAVWRLARGAYGVWQNWSRLKAWSEGLRAGPPAAR